MSRGARPAVAGEQQPNRGGVGAGLVCACLPACPWAFPTVKLPDKAAPQDPQRPLSFFFSFCFFSPTIFPRAEIADFLAVHCVCVLYSIEARVLQGFYFSHGKCELFFF